MLELRILEQTAHELIAQITLITVIFILLALCVPKVWSFYIAGAAVLCIHFWMWFDSLIYWLMKFWCFISEPLSEKRNAILLFCTHKQVCVHGQALMRVGYSIFGGNRPLEGNGSIAHSVSQHQALHVSVPTYVTRAKYVNHAIWHL